MSRQNYRWLQSISLQTHSWKAEISNVRAMHTTNLPHDFLHPSSPPPSKIDHFVHVYGWCKLKINLDEGAIPTWGNPDLINQELITWRCLQWPDSHNLKEKYRNSQGKRQTGEEWGRGEKGKVSKMKSRKISWLSIFLCEHTERSAGPLQQLEW